jgi:hypothetical protein
VNAVARIISFVFHPLFLTTYLFAGFAFILPSAWSPVSLDNFEKMMILLFLVTFLLPAINIYLFKLLGNITSLQMPSRKERLLPFIFISMVYCGVTYMIMVKTGVDISDNFLKFMIIIDALVVIGTIMTFFYKVSIHSLAITGIIGILLPLNKFSEEIYIFYTTLAVIVIAGIVMSARLQLQAHSLREVLIGGVLGLVIGFTGMLILFGF